MRITVDLHIHSGLSPCSLDEMSPNNIINMALLNDLQAIAITDHNSCENLRVIMEVGKENGLLVIPGVELETREEIHCVCLFSDLDDCLKFQQVIYDNLPSIRNKAKVFGQQVLYDIEDEVIGQCDKLLQTATKLTINKAFELCNAGNGILIPAHIDRKSASIISNLGMIPNDIPFTTLEISKYVDLETYKEKYKNYRIIQSSDAHELGHIGICQYQLDVCELSANAIVDLLKSSC